MWILLILFGALGFCNAVPLESRIIGGEDAAENLAPHMVALFRENIWHTTLMCGGSLITQSMVLTAAHCITPFVQDGHLMATLKGRVGSNNWLSGGTVVTFASHHIHPRWDPLNIKFDAGLLELAEKLKLSYRVRLIALDFRLIPGDHTCYVTGWGNTGPRFEDNAVHLAPTPDLLQLLWVTTLSHAQCEASFSAPQWSHAPALDHAAEICTFHSQGHGMCNGDSGSALVCSCSGRQVGVVSWGMHCAAGAPDVFTRVSSIRDFVLDTLTSFGDRLQIEEQGDSC